MATYTDEYLLNTGIRLKNDDHIIFNINEIHLTYQVSNTHLSIKDISKHGYGNDGIFLVLGIKDKYGFCDKHYGYSTKTGTFPSARENDYAALTRVAIALAKRCANTGEDRKITLSPHVTKKLKERKAKELYKKLMSLLVCKSKGKKVAINITDSSQSKKVQDILFANGFGWKKEGYQHLDQNYIFISADGIGLTYGYNLKYSSDALQIRGEYFIKHFSDAKGYMYLEDGFPTKGITEQIIKTKPTKNKKNNGKITILRRRNFSVTRGQRPTGQRVSDPRSVSATAVRYNGYRKRAVKA